MSFTMDEITKESLSLSTDEKTILAHRLWDSVANFKDSEVEQAWLAESDRRWKEIENGQVECVPHTEVMRRIKEKLNSSK